MTQEEIRAFRLKHGMSQQDLSNKIGVGWSTLNRWERGKVKMSRLGRQALERVRHELEQNTMGAKA